MANKCIECNVKRGAHRYKLDKNICNALATIKNLEFNLYHFAISKRNDTID